MANILQSVVSYLQRPTKPDQLLFPQTRSSGPLTANDLLAIIEGRRASGLTVSEYTALNLSAVWCAVTNIAGTVGKLPLDLYKRRADGGRDKYTEHTLHRILHDEPHPEMGAMIFRETLQQHVLLWGNGYAEILRDGGGRVRALQLITPNRVTPKRDERTQALFYEVDGTIRLDQSKMLHVRGLSFDGITGYSVVGKARTTLGLGMHTEQFGTSLFSNGPKWSGALQHPKGMSPQAKAALRADLKNLTPGDYPMFEEGIQWVSTGMPAKDAEFLATRQFQVEEIARWFNMPPHMLKDLMRATFSNIQHQGIDYLTHTIDPWLVKWEEEINRKLIAPLERAIQYSEFLREALTQADLEAKNASFAIGIQWGWLNRDEVRAKLNMNPIPDGLGGDFLVPGNMLPAEKLGEEPVEEPDEAPAEPPDRALPRTPDAGAVALQMLEAVLAARERERSENIVNAERLAPMIAEKVRDMLPAAPTNGHAADVIEAETFDRSAWVQAIVTDLKTEIQRVMPPPKEDDPEPAPEPPAPPPVPPPPPPIPPEDDCVSQRYHAQAVLAQRQLVAGVVRRMHAREKGRIREMAKKPERLRAWIGEFYPRHAEVFRDELLPAIMMHLAMRRSQDDPEFATRVLVEDYIEGSKRQLHALLDAHPSDLGTAVDALLMRWDAERVNVIPDAVMLEEMANHG
jgi:HK97 family phage portal protein